MHTHTIKKPLKLAWHLFGLAQQFLNHTAQKLLVWVETSQEIKVEEFYRDRSLYWRAYNPLNGQSICSGNELDIKAWIEQQLYR